MKITTFISGILAASALSLSLLTVVRPPLNILWKLSIPVMELGHFAAMVSLGGAVVAWLAGARFAALPLLVAAMFFASPLVRAFPVAARLERAFDQAFPSPAASAPDRPRALAARDLLLGVETPSSPARTFVYADDDSLALDFYPAAVPPLARQRGVNEGRAPCVVVVHGGGWDGGDRSQLATLNRYLAGAGYAVAAIDYRLAPGHVFPAPVHDVARALEFLRRRADSLGIDPARFVLLGRSAGGQVALQAAYTLKDPGIKGVVAFYAPADMVFGYSLPGNPRILDSRGVMERYLGGRCSEKPDLCWNSSPLLAVDGASPPTLLLHGRRDVLVSPRHADHLARRLRVHGIPHFTVDLPWATHGYDYVFSGPGSQISLRFILRFLGGVTSGE